MAQTVLIVDDEEEIAELLEVYLSNSGYRILKCGDGETALQLVENETVDLMLLDVMLPDIDGFTLCKQLRKSYYFPIIMLTARVADEDKIKGMVLGGDDYITKPFNPLEVTARVQAQLRRAGDYNKNENQRKDNVYDIQGLVVESDAHRCTLYGREITLTPTEFGVLEYLCKHRGEVVSTEELFEAVWKEKFYDSNNTVMAHIARLREKLQENARKPKFIKTVWGVGYKVDA
ncbi:MAG: VanR-ABDEGLN family response regulator transcription factor [Lachnospiraceae bacterium]|nr:VanR-ABDEGLN family response regulator transcription factor [Lachnospiraceae bacterium]